MVARVHGNQWGLDARIGPHSGNSIEELAPVAQRGDAKLLEVFRREVRQDRLVYLILAECRLVLFEAQAPQPTPKVHGGAHALPGA